MQEELGSYHSAEKVCDNILLSSTFVHQNLFDMVNKWTKAEGKYVYKSVWKKKYHVEMKKLSDLIIGVHKSKNRNVLQLWIKKDGHPLFKIMHCQILKSITLWWCECKNQR